MKVGQNQPVGFSAGRIAYGLAVKVRRAKGPARELFAQICPLWTQRKHLASDSNSQDSVWAVHKSRIDKSAPTKSVQDDANRHERTK
jgi:hypothetical protein